MSENKTNETNEELKENETPQADLYEELEQVRALFEETLKKEAQKAESPDSDEESDENDAESDCEDAEETENEEEKLCPRCENEKIGDGETYCEACRKAMLRTKVKLRGLVAIFVAVFIFFGSMVTCMDAVTDLYDSSTTEFDNFSKGYIAYRESKPISAAAYYESYLSQRQGRKNISATALEQLIDSYCRLGEYPYAAQIINTYYNEKALNMPANKKYKDIVAKNELNAATYETIVALVQNNYGASGYDYEKIVSQMKALKGQTDSEGKALYSDYVLDIFIFDFSAPIEKDVTVLYDSLKQIDAAYGKDEIDHIPLLCKYAALCGDTETAEESYNRMMKINSQSMSTYGGYFNSIRYSESPDCEKLIEICNAMSQVSSELYACNRYNFDYLYYFSVAYMIKGDAGELPFTFMQQLYDSINIFGESYEGNSRARDIFNMYALAAIYTGNTEAYEWAKAEMEYLGLTLNDAVIECEKGNLSVKEVLTDRKGELA